MAIDLNTEYPTRSTPADADYPYGSAKNKVSPVDQGTPVEKNWLNDIYGFLQALLVTAGVTPSGVPDTVLASDYLDAMRSLSGNLRCKVVDIGDWNMVTTTSVAVNHGITSGGSKIRAVEATIQPDSPGAGFPIDRGGLVSGWDNTKVDVSRAVGEYFDDPEFNATGYNRGWLTIWYTD